MRFILIFALLPLLFRGQEKDTSVCNTSCYCKSDPTPAGIMVSHVHDKNEWMVSYRFMSMDMEGIISGTETKTKNDVFANYQMAPVKMRMDMHMLMAMYGITDRLTVMTMFNYNINSMQMEMLGSGTSSHNSSNHMIHDMGTSGFSDIKLHLLYGLLKKTNHHLLISLGVSIPTGNFQLKGKPHATMYANERIPYSMQLGSGTYDLMPGINYLFQKNKVTFSIQGSGAIRPFYNSVGYNLGNECSGNLWLAYKWFPFLTTSLRTEGTVSNKINGSDPTLNYYNEISSNPHNYGGQKLNCFAGLAIHFQKGWIKNNRLGVEYGVPLYQSLNGIQMPFKQMLYASWSITF